MFAVLLIEFVNASYKTQLIFLIDRAMKLDCCVSAIVIGFKSIDDNIRSSQFIFGEEESMRNYLEGERACLYDYLLQHFCSPNSTILDLSNDREGTYTYLCIYFISV